MKLKVIHIFLFLCFAFLVYTFNIYLQPLGNESSTEKEKINSAKGRLVWQKYNCQACHQFYGLGGYLGPDLTNILSTPGKGEVVVRAIVASGVKQMPAFKLHENEMNELIAFLHAVDKSGMADPRTFTVSGSGMINLPGYK